MKKRMFAALGLAAAMCFCGAAFAACSSDPEDDTGGTGDDSSTEITEEYLCTGIWETVVSNDPSGRSNYLAFHEDGIFYHALLDNSMSTAGYWELVTEEIEVKVYASQVVDSYDDYTAATASAYLVLTNFDGSEYGNSDDSEDNIYPIYEDAIWRPWYDTLAYEHNTDSDHTSADETAVEIVKFVKEDAVSEGITIAHNGATVEVGDDFIEGASWTYDSSTNTYTITLDEGTATLTVSDDGLTAVYTSVDGTQISLVDPDSLSGVTTLVSVADTDGIYTLTFYSDGTYEMAYGSSTMLSGTWSWTDPCYLYLDDTMYQVTSSPYDLVVEFSSSSGTTYSATFSLSADNMTALSTGEAEAQEVVALSDTNMGGMYTLTFMDDGTYAMTMVYGTVVEGEWSWTSPCYLYLDETANMVTGTPFTLTVSFTSGETTYEVTFSLTAFDLTQLMNNEAATELFSVADSTETYTVVYYDIAYYTVEDSDGSVVAVGTWALDSSYGLSLDSGDANYMSTDTYTTTFTVTVDETEYSFTINTTQLSTLNDNQ